MASKRKGLSKKTRFDVFKRDSFKCQYCGAHPPSVILEVDHIKPVAEGGGDESDNLITSCFSCNRGKGAESLENVPQSLSDKAEMVKESEAQLRGYQDVMESRRERIEDEMWRVADALVPGSSEKGMSKDWTASIRRFNEKLGLHEVLDAAQIADAKFPYSARKCFLYFCGICWNKVRELEEGALKVDRMPWEKDGN
jgi:hypothetical protein